MTSPQPNVAGVPPAVAAGAARGAGGEGTAGTTTDEGVPVGAVDAEADARRAGADDDDSPRDVLDEGSLGGGDPTGATDRGVPVGAADAEEDRKRATSGDAPA